LATWEQSERSFVKWVQSVSRFYGELALLPPGLRRLALKAIGSNDWLRRRTIRCAAVRVPIGASARPAQA
jgi:hypothetical protein